MPRVDRATKDYFFRNPDVTSVGYGYMYTRGVKTEARCVIVGVKKKKPAALVRAERLIPISYQGQITDVQEWDIRALPAEREALGVHANSLVTKKRPCPPGYSIGHTAITAGTLGAYVRRVGDLDDWWILSNNHVLSASNQGKPNDKIIQPGKADGGFSGSDHFAWLREFVTINWDGSDGGGCNVFARIMAKLRRIRAIEQPTPNLVDAALALPVHQGYVNRTYPFIGTVLSGRVNLELGDDVLKVGRTTEFTRGIVEGVDVMTRVQYDGGTATFDDQIEIRSPDGKFSAGGDSGSAILDGNGELIGGLLFAGSSGADPVTIANRISNVAALLNITF